MTMLVWSERPEPNATGLKDCTYSAGLQALVFGGFTKFPLGIYTVEEREALERSDDQPNETGASLDDLIVAVRRRYRITWDTSARSLMTTRRARSDLAFIIQGNPGHLPAGHTLRRWDPDFASGHCVTITPVGDGIRVRWYDPLAPMRFTGDITSWGTVNTFIGDAGPEVIAVRHNAYAPAIYTEEQMAASQAALKEALTHLARRDAEITGLKNKIANASKALA